MMNQNNNKWDKAKENYEKAIELKPNDATNHHYYALYFSENQIQMIKNHLNT